MITNKEKYILSKDITNMIKGIAIILMMTHHFLGFPNWLIDGINYPNYKILGEDLNVWIRYSTKICVALFAFITGYAYYKKNNQTIKYGLKKIVNFLKKYWTILLLLFVPIVIFVCGRNLNIKTIILNLFALDKRLITHSWYVYFFIFAMLTLPLLKKISNDNFWHDFIVMIGICTVCYNLLDGADFKYRAIMEDIKTCFYWMPSVIIGWLVAKYDLFTRINNVFGKQSKILDIFMVFLIFGARLKWREIITINLDIIYAPFMIYFLSKILNNLHISVIEKILKFFCKNSLNLWFIHSLFAKGPTDKIFQPILYISSNPVIVVIWGILLCIPISILFNYIFKFEDFLGEKIKKKRNKKFLPDVNK